MNRRVFLALSGLGVAFTALLRRGKVIPRCPDCGNALWYSEHCTAWWPESRSRLAYVCIGESLHFLLFRTEEIESRYGGRDRIWQLNEGEAAVLNGFGCQPWNRAETFASLRAKRLPFRTQVSRRVA